MPAKICLLCNSPIKEYRHEWLFQCDQCGLLSSSLSVAIPVERTASVIDEGRRAVGLEAIRRKTNAIILDRLEAELKSNQRKILDVGCGPGWFLRDAGARGFLPTGIEPDGNVIDVASRVGSEVRHGFFPDVLSSEERFDAIVFNDVLEHLPNPKDAVIASIQHLNPGGILVLNCPDRKGIFYRVAALLDQIGFHGPLDRLWQRGLPSPHLWYFTAKDLDQTGRQLGLNSVGIDRIVPLMLEGLKERIAYVSSQSGLLNVLTQLGVRLAYPFLGRLPKDISIVYLRKI